MAAKKNPYQLSGAELKKGPIRAYKPLPLTEAEQLEKLAGYVAVPKTFWPNIKYATHVRYIESEARGGEFRSGGFVLKNPLDMKVRGSPTEKRFLKFQNGFVKTAQDYMTWIVAYEDIEFLYAKATGVELTALDELHTAVAMLNLNISRLAEYCKKLERRITDLERHR